MSDNDTLKLCVSDVFDPSRSLSLCVPTTTTVGQLKISIAEHHDSKPEVAVQRLMLYGKVLTDDNVVINTLVKASHLACATKAPVIHLVYKPLSPTPSTEAVPPSVPRGSDQANGSSNDASTARASTRTEPSVCANNLDSNPVPTQIPSARSVGHGAALPIDLPLHPGLVAAYHAALAALTNGASAPPKNLSTENPAAPLLASGFPFTVPNMPMSMMPHMMMPTMFVPSQPGAQPQAATPPYAHAGVHPFQLVPPYHPGTYMMCHPAAEAPNVPGAQAPHHWTSIYRQQAPAQPINAHAPEPPQDAAGPAAVPVRRVWTIRINFRAFIQFLVMLFMLYQHLSIQRFGMLIVGAAVLCAAQLGSLHQMLQNVVMRLAAPVLRRRVQDPQPAAADPAGGAAARPEGAHAAAENAAANVAPTQPSLLREVGIALLGFLASLLPNFNTDAADAAAIAAAQQGLMRDRRAPNPEAERIGNEEQGAAVM